MFKTWLLEISKSYSILLENTAYHVTFLEEIFTSVSIIMLKCCNPLRFSEMYLLVNMFF